MHNDNTIHFEMGGVRIDAIDPSETGGKRATHWSTNSRQIFAAAAVVAARVHAVDVPTRLVLVDATGAIVVGSAI